MVRSKASGALVALLALILVLVLIRSPFLRHPTFDVVLRNPGADPHIVYYDGCYYLTNTQGGYISVTRAKNLGGLASGETRTIWTDTDVSRNENFWAPEMHLIDGIWYIFYTAGSLDPGYQRSFVLRGCDQNPWDCSYSFLAELTPPIGGRGGSDRNNAWSIDGTYLTIKGSRYHVVSALNSQGLQSIQIAELDTTAWTVGNWSIISSPTETWEMAYSVPNAPVAVNEGPNALYHDDRTWLSFSACYCGTPVYSLGLLSYDGSGEPLNPASWTKIGPVFQSANGHFGVGHNVFFSSPDGKEIWNAYHATLDAGGSCGPDRYTVAQKVTFDSNGDPNLGIPTAASKAIKAPSGELL